MESHSTNTDGPSRARWTHYDIHGGDYETRRYSAPGMQVYLEHRSAMLESIIRRAFRQPHDLRILEVACGTGLSLQYLRGALPRDCALYGLDASVTMLRQAAEKGFGSRLAVAAAEALPFREGSFDVIYATRFIYGFGDEKKRRILRCLSDLLRPNGILIMEFYAINLWTRIRAALSRRARNVRERFTSYETARELMGGTILFHPVRVIGSGRLSLFFGREVARWMMRRGGALPHWLLDTYFAVSGGKDGAARAGGS